MSPKCMSRSIVPTAVLAVFLIAGGLFSCGGGDRPATWLVQRMAVEPNVLNMLHDSGDTYSQIMLHKIVYQTLIQHDNRTLEFKPMLAESWEESPDHLTFTFKLRTDVTWHDGKPLTADDVVFTFELMKDPEFPANNLGSYFEDCERVEKIDDHTVRFVYNKPYFLSLAYCGAGFHIMPAHAFDGVEDRSQAPIIRNPIGTGPYRFLEWKSGTSVTLERYEGYYGDKPEIDRIIFRIIKDDNTAIQALKSGEVDNIPRIETEVWFSETTTPRFIERFNKYEYDFPTYGYIGWNMRRPLFQDKRVRQALTMLVDRFSIAEKLYRGAASVITGPFFYKFPENNTDIEPWPFDPERAKALLSEAGWTDSNGDGVLDKDGKAFTFEFLYPSSTSISRRIGAIVRDEMAKAGIEVTLANMEWGSMLKRVAEDRDFDAVIMGWSMDPDQDPQQLWHSSYADVPNSSNHVGYQSDEADRLIAVIRDANLSRDERLRAFHEFHALLHEEQPYTFMVSRKQFMASDKRLQEIEFFAERPCYDIAEWSVATPG